VLANLLTCIPCQDGNGEFPIGFRSAIPVPTGAGVWNFPYPRPRKEHRGTSHPHPRSPRGINGELAPMGIPVPDIKQEVSNSILSMTNT
jgi:hypothetical protein